MKQSQHLMRELRRASKRFNTQSVSDTEWVIADSEELKHYYVGVFDAKLGKVPAFQVLIAVLGTYTTCYEFDQEVYSCIFYSTRIETFVPKLIDAFLKCRLLDAPAELVYAFGGTIQYPLRNFHTNREANQ